MITIKDISKEILLQCKKARPIEFENVTKSDIEQVCNIFTTRIVYLLTKGSLLAIKDAFLFRPNLQKRIHVMKIKKRKLQEKQDNAAYKSVGKNQLLDF
jgi:hypothetical protein